MFKVFSDGACKGNPGVGGWGVVIESPDGLTFEKKGAAVHTTNNQMELTGAIEALRGTPKGSSVVLTTDSKYVIDGITKWIHGWKKRDWQASTGGAVKNKELWQQLDAEFNQRSVTLEWVRGHTGHIQNERCDQLANEAIINIPKPGMGIDAEFTL